MITLREEIFAGRKFREFRELWPNSRKLIPFLIPENVDSRKLIPEKFLREENFVNFENFGQIRENKFLFDPRKCRFGKINSREIFQNW